jgi:murein endopeptidase
MPASDLSIGFRNHELEQTGDNHDFGTHWLFDVILAIAKDYNNSHRKSDSRIAPFVINDVSIPHGGNTPDHAGHETGLMCDVLLPKKAALLVVLIGQIQLTIAMLQKLCCNLFASKS